MAWPYPIARTGAGQNPTLVPNFDPALVSGSDLSNVSPYDFLASNPRAVSAGTITVGGTVTSGNTLTVEVSNGVFGSTSVEVTAGASDTVDTLAEKIAQALNDNATLQGVGAYADAAGAVVTLSWPGPVGNLSTIAGTVSSGGTETLAVVQMSGGSGPIIPRANFSFSLNYDVTDYMAGIPVSLDNWTLSQMVTQGMPIA